MNAPIVGADPRGRRDLPAVAGAVSVPVGDRRETRER
jgi:hypothetical protein